MVTSIPRTLAKKGSSRQTPASFGATGVTTSLGHDPVSSPAQLAHRRRRLTVASIGRRGWRQAKTSLTAKFDGRVTLPLADVLERVTQLQDAGRRAD